MTAKKIKIQVDFEDIDILIKKLSQANELADELISKVNSISNLKKESHISVFKKGGIVNESGSGF